MNIQICCECGDSVKFGSGKFVNRANVLDNFDTRKENGYPYPQGEYICAECDNKYRR